MDISRVELIRGKSEDRAFVVAELAKFRADHGAYVRASHPTTIFVTLQQLIDLPEHRRLIDPELVGRGLTKLSAALSDYGNFRLMPLDRVWVGIGRTQPDDSFGGFHHPDQGYRHFQECAILSIAGSMAFPGLPTWLATLELLKAYTHDTMHYNSYRTYHRLPAESDEIPIGGFSFYRLQYGLNFRKWNGKSYSVKDPVSRTATRNLGVVMEAAVDRFAQETVFDLARIMKYGEPFDLIGRAIYRDATGLSTLEDVTMLRASEKEEQRGVNSALPVERVYLKSLRLFTQYVTMRYRNFLSEHDPEGSHDIQKLVIEGILSGRFRALTKELDVISQQKRYFVSLFKSPTY